MLWHVQTASVEMQCGCIAELTHIIVLYFSLHRLLELFELVLEMGIRLYFIECCDTTHSTTTMSAIACFDGDISRFTRCGDKTTSGYASDSHVQLRSPSMQSDQDSTATATKVE